MTIEDEDPPLSQSLRRALVELAEARRVVEATIDMAPEHARTSWAELEPHVTDLIRRGEEELTLEELRDVLEEMRTLREICQQRSLSSRPPARA